MLAAGIGLATGWERKIVEVDVFGVTDLLTAWRSALSAGAESKVVVFGSHRAVPRFLWTMYRAPRRGMVAEY